LGLSTRHVADGAQVIAVTPDGPAAQAGIKIADVIQALNGKLIKDQDLESVIVVLKPGTKIVISYMRDAWAREVLVTVGRAHTLNSLDRRFPSRAKYHCVIQYSIGKL
jgi:S1-C subfamily serine protease